jgi:hypothetical protein
VHEGRSEVFALKHKSAGAGRTERAIYDISGAFLAEAVLPSLSVGQLDDATAQALLNKQEEIPSLVQCFPALLRLEPMQSPAAVNAILKAMTSRDKRSLRLVLMPSIDGSGC